MDTQRLRSDSHWLAWAAGIIDGEGTVLLAKNKANKTWTLRVVVGNTDPRMIAALHDLFGGGVSFTAARKGNWRPVWRWYVYHKKAEACLERVLPWLRVKRDQAELGLQARRLVRPRRGRRGNFRDPGVEARTLDIAAQMRDLRTKSFDTYAQNVPAADDQGRLDLGHVV